jgi:glycosyltransferase involved in cell wall biosynthesis
MSARVIDLDLAGGLSDRHGLGPYRRALVLLRWAGRPVGAVRVPLPGGSLRAADLQAAIAADAKLSKRLVEQQAITWLLQRPAGRPAPDHSRIDAVPGGGPGELSHSIIVCTRDRASDLRRCLDSLLRLWPGGGEIVVVDNAPSDQRTRQLCARYPVRYVREDRPGLNWARARGAREAGGEILLFTDDDVVVDPGWARAALEPFAHPRVAAVTGLTMPLELETEAQELFEAYGGFGRGFERRTFDYSIMAPAAAGIVGAGANMAVRRGLALGLRLFEAELDCGSVARTGGDNYAFYHLLAEGYQIVYEPAALVWHRHRRDYAALSRTLADYSIGGFAFLTRCLVQHGDWQTLPVALEWLWTDHARQLARALLRRPRRLPLDLVLAQIAAVPLGPKAYFDSRKLENVVAASAASAGDAEDERLKSLLQTASQPGVVAPSGASAADAESEGRNSLLLSVVIPSFNRRASLDLVLRALAAQSLPREQFEIIVVLDGSTDGSAELLRAWQAGPLPNLRWRWQPNAGQAQARNQGALLARAPVLVFVDDDIAAAPDLLAVHAARHAAGQRIAVLGDSRLVREQRESYYHLLVWAWWEDTYHRRALPGRQPGYRDFCAGNVSLRRDDFLAAGGFDPAFRGYGGEDFELGWRLLRAGVALHADRRAQALHYHRTTVRGNLRATRQEGRADVLLGRKHPELRAGLRLMKVTNDRYGLLIRLAMMAPRLGDALMLAERAALPLYERAQMRRRWLKAFNNLRGYAYWRGVRDALGSWPALRRYQAGALPLPEAHIELDAGGLPAELPPLWVDGPSRVALFVQGQPLGTLELEEPIQDPLRPFLAETIAKWLARRQPAGAVFGAGSYVGGGGQAGAYGSAAGLAAAEGAGAEAAASAQPVGARRA